MKEFKDRVAVVTGGASGIGKALARAFLGAGMKVVIADVEARALEAATRELGGTVSGVVTDVSSPESVKALADQVFAIHGACHILCNNAGVSAPNLDLWETEPSDFQWVHGVNVNGVAHGVQAFVPRMIASGEEGFVMNTSSGDGGISPLAQQVVYASSKAAVSIMTECLAAQLIGRGTRLRAAIFYPSGGMLPTGIWTTKRNRPAALARKQQVDPARETTFDAFMEGARKAGFDLPVQDLDELAQFALEGIRNGDFVIMIGRETMEQTLRERAAKLARGECPIELQHMGLG
ncbi:MAG: SDR family NAD(P)-dependent oxidoreductase [Gammaproteobacteria bacterium]|jgi:NAD(P)-dependent dehydrogenase (short-subunit alcohol dehydrogenase family)|nr:SDR family NAD(P)-dependent oxidoreductase [Gammaproteobacteria bacterium]MBP6052467.1 SDR family NAD(P)-dependent oxidoreductase [Pseudomonadales bacterium]MBK7168088.1 SDR family NAD(P)-dependent oxidoreductase [Gammaproteobacteria bacterium]MBK7519154.1 SDR family NAD(P)-dependent oxidoreductase [Gammaproteobacteria bacterium]MBK7730105.1 SDR family NAD(P)-dependent oxidoreductase [Gammaproteobacteria bacterium]